MNRISIAIPLALVFSLCLLACQKDNKAPEIPSFFALDPGLISHFGAYPGSYWIYQEDSTGWSDSVYVKSVEIDTVALLSPGNRNDTLCLTERMTVTMHTPFFGFDHIYRSALDLQAWIRDPNGPHFTMTRRSFHNNRLQPVGTIFYWPPIPNNSFQQSAGGLASLTQEAPTSVVLGNGLQFDQVSTVEIDLDPSEFNQNTRYQLAPLTGMIGRISLSNNLYWEAVRGRFVTAAGDTLDFPR